MRWEALYPRVVVAPCLARVERADDLPHLGGRQLVEAAEITLDPADVAYLEEPYRPLDNLLSLGFS